MRELILKYLNSNYEPFIYAGVKLKIVLKNDTKDIAIVHLIGELEAIFGFDVTEIVSEWYENLLTKFNNDIVGILYDISDEIPTTFVYQNSINKYADKIIFELNKKYRTYLGDGPCCAGP